MVELGYKVKENKIKLKGEIKMFLTQKSDGTAIAKLKTFIMDNADQMEDSILRELAFLYEEVDMEASDLEDDYFKLMDKCEQLEENVELNKEELYSLNTYIENQIVEFEEEAEQADDTMKEIKGRIDSIIEKFDYVPYEANKKENNEKALEQETIEKMIKLGYKFNGIEIKEEKPEPVKVEKPKLEVLPFASVKKKDDQTITITGYQLDVSYDIKRDKFSGKGARKYKEELKQRLEYYFKHEAV